MADEIGWQNGFWFASDIATKVCTLCGAWVDYRFTGKYEEFHRLMADHQTRVDISCNPEA